MDDADSKAVATAARQLELSDDVRRRWNVREGAEYAVFDMPEGLLLRPLDPPLKRVYVEPTSFCNLTCRGCMRHSWNETEGTMSMDTFRRLCDGLRQVPSLRAMSFWGFGEPLLHPNILDMLELAKGLGVRTDLVTNGTLLSPEIARGLVETRLDSLVVSVDGSDAVHGELRSGADLAELGNSLEMLRRFRVEALTDRPEIGLEVVISRRNVDNLAGIRKLASDFGASFIVVSNLLPYVEDMKEDILYWLSAGTWHPEWRQSDNPEVRLPRFDMLRENVMSMAGLLEKTRLAPRDGRPGAFSNFCRFVGEGSLCVAWDGSATPCIPLLHSYDCFVLGRSKHIKRFVVGNVGETDVADLWGQSDFRSFRSKVQRFEFPPCTDCEGCQLAETNERDCRGNHFPVCGDCLWAKGVIQCP